MELTARWLDRSEFLEYDFKETERLEARIAKQTRYCAELKAMEEMRSRT